MTRAMFWSRFLVLILQNCFFFKKYLEKDNFENCIKYNNVFLSINIRMLLFRNKIQTNTYKWLHVHLCACKSICTIILFFYIIKNCTDLDVFTNFKKHYRKCSYFLHYFKVSLILNWFTHIILSKLLPAVLSVIFVIKHQVYGSKDSDLVVSNIKLTC